LDFQAIEDFFRRGIARRPTLRVKVSHDFDQPINPDLGIVGKFQYPLTNCRRFGFASGDSADDFKLRHNTPPQGVLYNLDLFFHLLEFPVPGNQFCL
jgi:hypothetical protein